MTSKDRVKQSLTHKEPDRVPLFYRDIPATRERLISDLSLKKEELLFRELGIDFRWVSPEYIGPPLDFPDKPNRRKSIWGIESEFTPYGESDGYWNPVLHPMAGWEDSGLLESYPWPKLDWFDFSGLKADCEKYSDYAVMTAPSFASPGILQDPMQPLVGDEQSFMLPYLSRPFFDELVRRIVDFNSALIEKMLSESGDQIMFMRIGDDFGTQNNLLMSTEMWEDLFLEAYRRFAGIAADHGAFYYHHTCGAIYELIPSLIKAGVNVLDPVQVSAQGMDLKKIKSNYGDSLVFSGALDEAGALSNGSAAEVREETFRVLEIMSPGGGFFFGPTHNFQTYVPTDNIVAMYEAAREFFK